MTTRTNHTPGPWRAVASNDPNWHIEAETGYRIATVYMGDSINRSEFTEDNAQLIAQAPEMAQRIEELEAQNATLAEALSHVSARLECVREAAIKEPKGALYSWFIAQDHGLYEGVNAALALVREGKGERK